MKPMPQNATELRKAMTCFVSGFGIDWLLELASVVCMQRAMSSADKDHVINNRRWQQLGKELHSMASREDLPTF